MTPHPNPPTVDRLTRLTDPQRQGLGGLRDLRFVDDQHRDHELGVPDLAASSRTAGGLEVRAVSFQGPYHRLTGEARQDSFAIHRSGGRVCLAVADGVGSCRRSAVGSALAVRQAVHDLVDLSWDDPSPAAALLEGAATRLRAEAAGIGCAEDELSTTLTVAVVDECPERDGSHRCLIVSAGDSPALLLDATGGWHQLTPEDGGPKDVVQAYLPGAREGATAVGARLPAGAVLVLASDGFSNPLGDGRSGLGASLAGRWCAGPRPLLSFVVDLSFEGHHDDRTVVATWIGSPFPDGATEVDGAAEDDGGDGRDDDLEVEVVDGPGGAS